MSTIDGVIVTAATHLLMVQRHTPEQVADYLVRMADQTGHFEPWPLQDIKTTGRWAEAKSSVRIEPAAQQ